ncbi:conserved hypothetical protein [Histoplasma capsulatum H143]|uniref:S-adenosyl-L-methionine-dependent methyltransferase n=1 Tax=Ajellomyces capsulatus (strain H143) TaxID=544712 RepID=C6HNC1_AJECH|nr:conserved hypothetical protein [Histoplasma capsulatum H143]
MAQPAQPAQAAAHIVVDDSEHEVEAFDDDFSETSSIASSIYQFRMYCHPAIRFYYIRSLVSNHLSIPQKVLDVGTGTGIWAIDFADQHPEALVIGTDLSPTQPGWVPPNVKFQVDDATDYPWTFGTNTFDYIHVRDLFGSIPDWTAFMNQCFTCLKPGGYLEVSNASVWLESDDGSIPADAKHPLRQWGRLFRECGEIMGKTTSISENQRDVMIDAGFEAVEETRFKLVVGPWPKDPVLKQLGRYRQLECLQGCEGWALALLTRVLKWDVEEVQVLLANFRACVKDRNIHSYTPVSVVVGRKPLGDGQGV